MLHGRQKLDFQAFAHRNLKSMRAPRQVALDHAAVDSDHGRKIERTHAPGEH